MPRTLKLGNSTDGAYWDADAIALRDPGDGNWRTLSTVFREYEWGTITNAAGKAIGVTTITGTFKHTFKEAPCVFISLATTPACEPTTAADGKPQKQGNEVFGATLITINSVSTTGFTFKFHKAKKQAESTWKFNWIAVSKADLTKTITCRPLVLSGGTAWDTRSIMFSANSHVAGATNTTPVKFQNAYSQVGNGKRPLIVAFTSEYEQVTNDNSDLEYIPNPNYVKKHYDFANYTTRKFKSAPTVLAMALMAGDKYTMTTGSTSLGKNAKIAPSRATCKSTVFNVTTTGFDVAVSNASVKRNGGPQAHFLAIGEEDVEYV